MIKFKYGDDNIYDIVMQQPKGVIQICEISYYQGDLERIKIVGIFYVNEEKAKKTVAYFDVLDQNSIASYDNIMMDLYSAAKNSSKYIKGNDKGDIQIVQSMDFPEDGYLFDIGKEDAARQSELISSYLSQRNYYNLESYRTEKAWVSCLEAIDKKYFSYVDNKRKYLSWDDVNNFVEESKKKIEGGGYKVTETFFVVKTFLG